MECPVVAIRNLTVCYDGREVLRDITLSAENDFLVIIGPNGAGKTTLLKAIAGLVDATRGYIEISGRPLQEWPRRELAKIVSMVQQRKSPAFAFTVAETVLMGRAPYLGLIGRERKKDYEIVMRAMELTGISHLGQRRVDQVSGGELQRVLIARALCQTPSILLLDEPTSALDPAHQFRIMDLVSRLQEQEGLLVIMVSHDLNMAAMYGRRVAMLKDGRLKALGNVEDVLDGAALSKHYGCPILVEKGPLEGMMRVAPVPHRYARRLAGATAPVKVQVTCHTPGDCPMPDPGLGN